MSISIIGASLGGLQVAQTLRRSGYEDAITMVGGETFYPYDRPPLSKQYLAGDWSEEKLTLRGAQDPEALGLTWKLGSAAVGLDVDTRTVSVADGSTVKGDQVVIATGARARTLPGCELDGVFVLRNLTDARSLRAALVAEPKRVVVIGAGFIGAEVASTCRGLGIEVTMIEAAAAPLDRVLDLDSGMAIAELHRANGVDLRLGIGVVSLDGEASVSSVTLSDGSVVEADVVVVGIGAIPNTEWLEDSGLSIDNGVVCDETCLAAPGIWAIGDVARWPNQLFGGSLMRVEQWDNAITQGTHVAQGMVSDKPAVHYAPVPWFWSDQYDRKIQVAGLTSKNAELIHGDVDEGVFVKAFTTDDGKFCGAMAWNRPRHAIISRQLIGAGASIEEAREKLA